MNVNHTSSLQDQSGWGQTQVDLQNVQVAGKGSSYLSV